MTGRYCLTLAYRGTRYAGWATQPSGQTGSRPTLQGTLERALSQAFGQSIRVTAAGRTDAGVHAEAQVVTFDAEARLPAEGLRRMLGTLLPEDFWVREARLVDREFDARRSALRRWYRYAVWRGAVPDSGWHGRALPVPEALDVRAMRRAGSLLLGRQDRRPLVGSFAQDREYVRSTVRTVYAADWLAAPDSPLLTFEICADAFLRHMVRIAVGSLLLVGRGRWSVEDFAAALASDARRSLGPTAPALGLTLLKIEYPSLPN